MFQPSHSWNDWHLFNQYSKLGMRIQTVESLALVISNCNLNVLLSRIDDESFLKNAQRSNTSAILCKTYVNNLNQINGNKFYSWWIQKVLSNSYSGVYEQITLTQRWADLVWSSVNMQLFKNFTNVWFQIHANTKRKIVIFLRREAVVPYRWGCWDNFQFLWSYLTQLVEAKKKTNRKLQLFSFNRFKWHIVLLKFHFKYRCITVLVRYKTDFLIKTTYLLIVSKNLTSPET